MEGRPGARDFAGNTFSAAGQLSISSNVSYAVEHVGADDPVDYYRFDLSKDETFTIASTSFSQGLIPILNYDKVLYVELLDSQGNVLSSSNSTQIIPTTNILGNVQSIPLIAGTYYIRIQPDAISLGNINYFFVSAI